MAIFMTVGRSEGNSHQHLAFDSFDIKSIPLLSFKFWKNKFIDLSMNFVRSYFFTNATLTTTSCPLFFILSSHLDGFAVALLFHQPKSDDKMKSGQMVRVAFVKK